MVQVEADFRPFVQSVANHKDDASAPAIPKRKCLRLDMLPSAAHPRFVMGDHSKVPRHPAKLTRANDRIF
jgi:hypothetical protein